MTKSSAQSFPLDYGMKIDGWEKLPSWVSFIVLISDRYRTVSKYSPISPKISLKKQTKKEMMIDIQLEQMLFRSSFFQSYIWISFSHCVDLVNFFSSLSLTSRMPSLSHYSPYSSFLFLVQLIGLLFWLLSSYSRFDRACIHKHLRLALFSSSPVDDRYY